MKKLILLVFVFTSLYSCTKDVIDNEENYFLKYSPRECEYTKIQAFGSEGNKDVNGLELYSRANLIADSILTMDMKGEDLFLSITTSNYPYEAKYSDELHSVVLGEEFTNYMQRSGFDTTLDANDLILERILAGHFALKYSPKYKETKVKLKTALHFIEYRTSGAKDFKVYALDNKDLNSKIDITSYFKIIYFLDHYIIGYDSKEIIYDKNHIRKDYSIGEWLSLKPIISPYMALRFREIPNNLPPEVRFEIDILTTENVHVRDTSWIVRFGE